MQHLWESDHPYYCAEGCYFATRAQSVREWGSVAEYLSEFSDSDVDMNLIWRWDWYQTEGATDGSGVLTLHMMHQRKGYPYTHTMPVTADDEVALRLYLAKHWKAVQAMWSPLLPDESELSAELAAQVRARRIAALKAELSELEAR